MSLKRLVFSARQQVTRMKGSSNHGAGRRRNGTRTGAGTMKPCKSSTPRKITFYQWPAKPGVLKKKRLARQVDGIIDLVWAEMDKWEARLAARASVTNTQPEQPKPGPSVTNKGRRAAGWEARNQEKVREQTKARVMNHRSRNPEQYREYMRESMQKKRARQAA